MSPLTIKAWNNMAVIDTWIPGPQMRVSIVYHFCHSLPFTFCIFCNLNCDRSQPSHFLLNQSIQLHFKLNIETFSSIPSGGLRFKVFQLSSGLIDLKHLNDTLLWESLGPESVTHSLCPASARAGTMYWRERENVGQVLLAWQGSHLTPHDVSRPRDTCSKVWIGS